MTDLDPSAVRLASLVEACHARLAGQLRARERFFALSVGLSGLCGLLVLGTRYVPVPMALLVVCLGAWAAWQRMHQHLPDRYSVAQLADVRAGLADALATAYHFRDAPRRGRNAVIRVQREAAEHASRRASPEQLFPAVPHLTRRVAAWLLGAALVLAAIRVAVQENVTFEPPLPSILLAAIFGSAPPVAGQPPTQPAALVDPAGDARLPSDESPARRAEAGQDTEPPSLTDDQDHAQAEAAEEPPEVEGLIPVPLDEEAGANRAEDTQAGSDGQQGRSDDGEQTMPPPPDGEWDEQAQSLLDKLKQAFENMLQTLDMASFDSSEAESSADPGSGSSDQPSADAASAESQASELDPAGQSADASMEGGEPGSEAGESASAGATTGEDTSGQTSSGENASAAGSSDGDKTLAEAMQLEAFGALEQLYMERAENMVGEVTVETRLAEQSATVPYTQTDVPSGEGSGVVTRDEVPAAYRTYVRNYFEALREDSR
ncbi:MAG: hypothetical protein OXN89_10550 [Bryobacterales bacterium]|nr:hypothetical protein [Bryobacterales bacterium]